MRLLILTSQVSPYHNARYVGATDYFGDVHVLSTINAGAFPGFITNSLGHFTLHRLFEGSQAYATAAASGELLVRVRETIEQIGPDAIAAAGWTAPESLVALEYGRANGVPVVVMSESQADDARRFSLREKLKRRVVSQFDAALVGGPSHACYAAALGIARDRIHFGYNAVDNAYFSAGAEAARLQGTKLRGALGLPTRYILASARFIPKKNLENLVHAYAEARSAVAPALVILGDGPERASIERAVAESGQEEFVHLLGFRGYDLLPAIYGLSEGFVHVSTAEQWGLVINEAMSSGVPVIASRPCGAARTVMRDGITGLLTGIDIASISDALVRLFHMTPEQRSAMGLAGAFAIRDWGPERFGSGMWAAVDSAFGAPRRGPIALWDRAILNRLQRKIIDTVA